MNDQKHANVRTPTEGELSSSPELEEHLDVVRQLVELLKSEDGVDAAALLELTTAIANTGRVVRNRYDPTTVDHTARAKPTITPNYARRLMIEDILKAAQLCGIAAAYARANEDAAPPNFVQKGSPPKIVSAAATLDAAGGHLTRLAPDLAKYAGRIAERQ